MKNKLYSFVCALVCLTMFCSCDPTSVLDDLLGEMTLTVANCNSDKNPYRVGDTINFKSSIVDETDLISADSINTIFLGANIELSQAEVLTTPYCGFQLKDTIAKSYPITISIDSISDIANLKPDSLLTSIGNDNVFIMPVSDTAWFIGYDGTITLNDYPEYGHLAEGNFDSVKAYYITNYAINYITDLVNRAANLDMDATTELQSLTLETAFATVTFNGSFASRRANIATIIESLIAGE